MTSNDANGFAPAGRIVLRKDRGEGQTSDLATGHSPVASIPSDVEQRWARIERWWWRALILTMIIFSVVPLSNLWLGLPTKDYGLWYQVGLAVREGLDIYPRPETGRLFPFMYPPAAAVMLAFVSMLGSFGSLLAMVILNSVAWAASVWLSVWLCVGTRTARHPLVLIVPTLSVIVLIYNIYLLGQPNLILLALLLGTFACLRLGRSKSAGALLATAAAIKAFPILALGYLIYRRMWTASVATVVILAAWLLVAPLAFRTPAQAVDDLVVWSKGMLFTYNSNGIAQRPFRSYSYKNQSIMAVAHRLLRDMPADGESVLSKRVRSASARPKKGLPPIDPATDLLTRLKPHAQARDNKYLANGPGTATDVPKNQQASTSTPSPRWDDDLHGAESALRAAWRVNVADLDFRAVTAVTVTAMLALCLFVVVVLPASKYRTPQTDAIEFAIVTLLTVVFSPLSFNYAYVWLMYPTTLALSLVLSDPPGAPRHRLKVAWILAVLFIPALAIPMPLLAQAYGNLIVPAILLVFGLGLMLYAAGRRGGAAHALLAASSPYHARLEEVRPAGNRI